MSAGRKLFGEKGLYESRIEDLTRYAGIAKGTLYGYFKNKEQLIEGVVTSGFSDLLGHARHKADGARTRTEVVSRLVEAHLTFFEENPDLMRIFHQVRGMLKFKKPGTVRLRGILAKYLAGLAHLLALHRPVRRKAGGTTLQTAMLLFGAISGIASTRASLGEASSGGSRSRTTVSALVELVLAFENGSRERKAAGVAAVGDPAPRPGRTAVRRAGVSR